MPRNTSGRADDVEAMLAARRLRRAFFPDLVAAFWPGDQPPAISGANTSLAWWTQRDLDDEGRLRAAAGEVADR